MGVSTVNVLFVLIQGLGYDAAKYRCRQDLAINACAVVDSMSEDNALFFGISGFSAAMIYLNYPIWL